MKNILNMNKIINPFTWSNPIKKIVAAFTILIVNMFRIAPSNIYKVHRDRAINKLPKRGQIVTRAIDSLVVYTVLFFSLSLCHYVGAISNETYGELLVEPHENHLKHSTSFWGLFPENFIAMKNIVMADSSSPNTEK